MPNSSSSTSRLLPHRTVHAIILFCVLLTPCLARALNLAGEVELLTGYDDNINRKEESRRTQSAFLSIVPALSMYVQRGEDVTVEGGYELAYTRYLADDLHNRVHHRGWGEITTRLRPRLFADLTATFDALENRQNPEDDGSGFSLSPGLTYHVSDRLSTRIDGIYSRWRYDSLNFDTGRAIVTLEKHQVDDRYEGEVSLVYLLSLGTYLDLAYRAAYNDSNNAIDEYNTNSILARINATAGANTMLTVGYDVGKCNYFNWRAGKKLKGKLRDDIQHHLRLGVEYASSQFVELFFNFEMTFNNSNLAYESYDRRLVYGGIRLNW